MSERNLSVNRETEGRRLRLAAWGGAVVLVVLIAGVFLPVLWYDFVCYDDEAHVLQNPFIRSLSPRSLVRMWTSRHINSYYPVRQLSLALDFRVWGENPGGYHLTNLLLHMLNAVLLGAAAYRIRGASAGAAGSAVGRVFPCLFAAALFGVHPVVVEPVAWISGREELLMTFFVLACLHAYVTAVRGTQPVRHMALVCLCALLACLSNAMAVVLPALLAACDWCFARAPGTRGREWLRAVWRRTWPVWLIAVGATVVKLVWIREFGTDAALFAGPFGRACRERGLVILDTYARNLTTLVWPRHLAISYVRDVPETLWAPRTLAGAGCLLLTGLALWRARKNPPLCFGLLWLVVSLAPSFQLMPHHIFRADRFLYLPLVGVAFAVGIGVLGSPPVLRRAMLVWSLGGMALLGLALRTALQLPVWQNGITLFSHGLKHGTDHLTAHRVLGRALAREGRHEEAIPHFEIGVEGEPGQAEAHYAMGDSLWHLGRLDEAVAHYSLALGGQIRDLTLLNHLGAALAAQEKWEDAAAAYSKAVALVPDSADAHQNLGAALAAQGRVEEAVQEFSRAVRLLPDLVPAYLGLGSAFLAQDRLEEAIRHFSEVLRIVPGHPRATRQLEEARRLLQERRAQYPEGGPARPD